MATDPIPVVVCSSHGTAGSMPALAALQAGAVEVVAKPHISLREFVQESALLLTDAVRAAAHARRRPIRRMAAPVARAATRAAWSPSSCIIAMAASTGGPQALEEVLSVLPPESPGIVVVQHMPPGFTKAFAAHLDRVCALEVKEAAHGDAIVDGRVLIAPGDHHLLVRRKDGHHVVTVTGGPLVTRHRPSADVLFQSVAESVGAAAFGVIMTGMGSDGARGIAAMKTAGATTVAQDEESCVVFGMPKEAVARGAVDETVPLGEIAERIRLWKPNFGRGDELQRAVV